MSGPFGASQWMYATDSGFYDFPISKSLRFNSDDDPILSKTYGSAGTSVDTWTVSWWMKLSEGNAQQKVIFGGGGTFVGGSNVATFISMGGSSYDGGVGSGVPKIVLQQYNSGEVVNVMAPAFLRDHSAWYHCVVRFDSTQSTDTNRVRIYINGIESPSYTKYDGGTVIYPNQNADSTIGGATEHYIGKGWQANKEFGGYMADFNYCDGQSLAPSSFGEFKNDIWIPKNTSGLTFGDNGFRMEFKQTGTGTNASGMGADTSGNNNHYAVTNLVANDVVPDSPTNNFATYNSQDNPEGATLTNGNLKCTSTDAAYEVVLGTIPFSSGKYYWEQNATSGNAVDSISVATTAIDPDKRNNNTGASIHSVAYYAGAGGTGSIYWDDTGHQTGVAGWAAGDVMSVACDMDNKTIQFRKNNSLIYTASSDANGNITNTWNDMIPVWSIGSGASGKSSVVNFGQDSSFHGQETAQGNTDENGIGDFYYAPPSGYLALCTANLPDPHEAVDPNQGNSVQDYFQTKLYTGNGASSLDIDIDFDPEVVWIKNRSSTYSHILANKLAGDNKFIATNGNDAEETDDTKFRNFSPNGNDFRVGTHDGVNASGSKYVSWNWRAGASTSANTDGTINTSATSATPMGSYSIGLYTGNATDNQTIGHGLGGTPDVVIIRPRDDADNWVMSWGSDNLITGYNAAYMYLNTNGAAGGSSNGRFLTNDSDTVNLGTSWNNVNKSGKLYFMQCYRTVDGVTKCGTYEGNSNANGTFVYTGFKPAWLLFKKLNSSDDWAIHDNMRADTDVATGNSNAIQKYLKPNENNSEQDDGDSVDFISNGFKWRINSGMRNNDGDKYIYIAFAEQPFKYANAR